MKNIFMPFRGAIKQNRRKTEDKHPDFIGSLTIWNEIYDAAAWLTETQKGRPYIALRLSKDRHSSRQEKIKIAIWEHHGRTQDNDPHFAAVTDIAEQKFRVQAWILPDSDRDAHRLVLTIEALESASQALSDAGAHTQQKLEAFVRSKRLTPQLEEVPKSGPVKDLPSREPQKPVPTINAAGEALDIPF